MTNLRKLVENKKTHYLYPVGIKFDERSVLIDASYVIQDAIRVDKKRGYDGENGPAYGIECQRIEDYAAYVAEHATVDNLLRFSTKNMMVFLASAEAKP